jgi:hypothetical protein
MFLLTTISRAHSSGSENTDKQIFETIEELAIYVHDIWYDDFCQGFDYPNEWDEEDMGVSFPSKDEFTLESIQKKIMTKKSRRITLFGYYSNFCCLIPYELILEEIK